MTTIEVMLIMGLNNLENKIKSTESTKGGGGGKGGNKKIILLKCTFIK
jgi:hypothetical protein